MLCEDGSKKGLYVAERLTLTRRSLNLAACGGKRALKKHEVTFDPPAFGSCRPGQDLRRASLHARRSP